MNEIRKGLIQDKLESIRFKLGGSFLSRFSFTAVAYNKLFGIFSGLSEIKYMGLSMKVDTNEELGRSMLNNHEDHVMKKCLSMISDEDAVIDIGAHYGAFSIIAADKVGSNGKVIAFEPHPDNFSILLENVELNDLNNLRLENKCLGDKEKITQLNSSPDITGRSFVSEVEKNRQKSINQELNQTFDVKMNRLDKYMSKNNIETASLVKVDVEGAELHVLKGCKSCFSKIEKMVIEIHANHNDSYNEDLFNLMISKGKITTIDGREIKKPTELEVDWLYNHNSSGSSHIIFEPNYYA